MAENLFEKYGIKEVADVTLYRIERKNETYESQRKISISSILKGALTKEMVYPLDEDGKGDVDGYEAYVFKDADILTHFNYDCDDIVNVRGTATFIDNGTPAVVSAADLAGISVGDELPTATAEKVKTYLAAGGDIANLFAADNVKVLSLVEENTNRNLINNYKDWLANNYIVNDVEILPGREEGKERVIYKGIYTGDNPTEAFTGTIVATISMTDPETIDGTITLTFDNTPFASVSGVSLSTIISSLKNGGTINKIQLAGLVKAADTNDTITVDYAPAADAEAIEEDIKSVNPTLTITNTTLEGSNSFLVYFSAAFITDENTTGHYDPEAGDAEGHYHMDIDREHGTHEFSYPEQICMLYAKNQNLITKAGTRYSFVDPERLFGAFEFNDKFASAPNGTKQVVVVGLSGKISESLYDFDEINDAIKEITDTIEAKAYDIFYSDYAELVVENEMGYYLPQQLGYSYDKKEKNVSFFNETSTYSDWAKNRRGIDLAISGAVNTWGDELHYSINDAIDALKQQQKVLDTSAELNSVGFERVFGGYRVSGKNVVNASGTLPIDDIKPELRYSDYTINGNTIYDIIEGKKLSSTYQLEEVLNALAIADLGGEVGQIRVFSTQDKSSNRAIYVDTENGVLANGAFIYLLKNISGRALASDTDGIFEFYDKKGNRLYYQDKIFAGTATLALVVIGTMGLIFVVNRCGTKTFKKTAWMINDGGYITDKQAERIVKNGLIHTVTITEDNESFDATCSVHSIKVRKTTKNVLHYIPVLFLDTLKVSTLEGAATSTDATGGRGNAKLITWDYGKEITLTIQDALYTPASMSAIWAGTKGDLKNGVKDTHMIDRMEKITAKRSFIIPAGNQEGTPTEGNVTAQAVYYDPNTMEPFQDGTPIAEGEVIYKFTRSVAYDDNSIGNTIEVSADGFPGTYRVVGETMVRDKKTGEDQRFQFIIPEAKMSAESTSITLQADGEPVVFDFTMKVLRPDNGVMMKFVQFDVEENIEENDGSTMVKNTENLNLLDDAEMYKVSGGEEEELIIGATEY